MKVLHLTLKRKWFDMIVSGEKKEEYRELKKFWASRLLVSVFTGHGYSFTPYADVLKRDFKFKAWRKFAGNPFKDFDMVCFRNGYSEDALEIYVECTGIKIGVGESKWGAPDKECFIISLGEVNSIVTSTKVEACRE